MVVNIHQREFEAAPEACAALLDSLGSDQDRIWPSHRWPRMRLDGPLAVGTEGGHWIIRYRVEAYEPGRSIHFRFHAPKGFHGWHRFEVAPASSGRMVLRHTMQMRTQGSARLAWPLAIRWMHDAVLEDALDRAHRELTGEALPDRKWNPWVRFLRAALRRRR